MTKKTIKEETPTIFLYNPKIPRFYAKGLIQPHPTIMVSHESIEEASFDSSGFLYKIYASAVKYQAMVNLSDSFFEYEEKVEPMKMALFHGGIQIYKHGETTNPDKSKIEGYQLATSGRIWAASKNLDATLRAMVFGRNTSERDMKRRIEQIIAGYAYQEKMGRESERKAIDSARASRSDMADRGFGMR